MPNRRDTGSSKSASSTVHRLPAGLDDLLWELPRTFLGLDGPTATPEAAGTWILPVPYEATTAWGAGTRFGPRAIIDASRYIELFDDELARDPSTGGVYTFPALEIVRGDAARAMDELESAYTHIVDAADGRRLIMLGGEHSISSPAIASHAKRIAQAKRIGQAKQIGQSKRPRQSKRTPYDKRPRRLDSEETPRLTVLQFDAHLDLRKSHDGNEHSHACAMRHVVGEVDVVVVGARGISGGEWRYAQASDHVTVITADEMARADDWDDRVLRALGPAVYVTFDVDFFDPSFMPSTGTPEPGGGDWYTALSLLRRVFTERRVVGADVVELAPVPGLNAPDFAAAKLVYKIIGYWSAGTADPRQAGRPSEAADPNP